MAIDSPIQMEVWMGKPTLNDGLPIAMFDDQGVTHQACLQEPKFMTTSKPRQRAHQTLFSDYPSSKFARLTLCKTGK